jgi:OOP family OmpA-OmpF porin
MNHFSKVVLFYILLLVGNTFSQVNLKTGNILSTHKLQFNESIGLTLTKSDYSDIGSGFNIKAGADYYYYNYNNHFFGGRISASLMELEASDPNKTPSSHVTDVYSLNMGLLYGFQFDQVYYPFASIGFSVLYFDPRDSNRNKLPGNAANKYDKITTDFYLEAGLKYRISKNFLIFGEGSLYIHTDDLIDDNPVNSFPDFYGTLNFGLSYAFSFEKDQDDDGIPDQWDKCEFTPSNVEVDEYGCPVDNDIDGVPDYRDRCLDSPIGIEVDRFGCVFDEDNDGVPDYKDECEKTPKNVSVDSLGCPRDSDKDGVPDYLDLCPDTEEGAEVDTSGCYVIKDNVSFLESIILNFDSGKSEISEYDYSKLDKAAFYINAYTDITWYIEGHSDSIEKDETNEPISLTRAKSVLDYLLRKGVSLSKLKVVDRGSSFNIANNSTASGREKNRRVVIFGIK